MRRPLLTGPLTFLCLGVLVASACGVSEDPRGEIGPDAGNDSKGDEPDGTADADLPDAGLPPDLCAAQAASCPSAEGLVEGQGLQEIDVCPFPMRAQERESEAGAIVDLLASKIPEVTLGEVLSDLNRTGTSEVSIPGNPVGLQRGFGWQSGDQSVPYWIPQGVATSANSDYNEDGRVDGREVALVSWYYAQDKDPGSTAQKGVRIAITDVSGATPTYRFVLLAEPAMVDGKPTLKPVRIHAGGMAWFGHYLYVVHTGVGLRVFDLDRMLQVPSGKDVLGYDAADDTYYAHNYRYVLPQVEVIAHESECTPRYSFLSLDRSGEKPALLSGEYSSQNVAGRLYRWPLNPETGRFAQVEGGRTYPSAAFLSGHSHLQGALSFEGQYWLSSSKPTQGRGVLYRTGPGTSTQSLSWNDSPEDMAYDPLHDAIWSLSEGLNARYLFRVGRQAISP